MDIPQLLDYGTAWRLDWRVHLGPSARDYLSQVRLELGG